MSDPVARLLRCERRELGSGVSPVAIAAAEQELGIRIEGGYHEFLRRFGWGGVEHLELYGLGGPRTWTSAGSLPDAFACGLAGRGDRRAHREAGGVDARRAAIVLAIATASYPLTGDVRRIGRLHGDPCR